MRGGALSPRTLELLSNQYQGITRDRSDRPTILELIQFRMDNNIQEPLREIVDYLKSSMAIDLEPLPADASQDL